MTSGVDLPTAYTLIALDTCESTNDEAKRLAALGEDETPDGTLVWSLVQTQGRGRRGRAWESKPGNLQFSLVLRPEAPIERGAQLGFAAALALFDAFGSTIPPGHEAHCKWPNDLLLNGSKVAGILMETSGAQAGVAPEWIVLGVGVNILWAPENTEFPATSLRAEGIDGVTPEMLLSSFGRHFLHWVTRWLDDGFAPLRKNWLWRAYGKGETVRARIGESTVVGTFDDIDETGALRLSTDDGPTTVAAGDVFFDA
jgi:BirA family biotin operon repressor/biotin-[acetyl-CoA-carboxylase] ligase